MKSRADSRLPPDVIPPPKLHADDVPIPGRTFIRNQGCWNCKHFEQGPLYSSHRLTRRLADMKVLLGRGVPFEQAERDLKAGDHYMSRFNYGICLGGGTGADFVPARFKCHRWSGRGGLRTEARQDDLVEDLKDKLGDPT